MGLYYLQSRYYDPDLCRFLNADAFVSTGQGELGNNMFAYCLSNPVNMIDCSGEAGRIIELGMGWYCRIDPENTAAGVKRHIHIWNNRKEYMQNDDGSPHDKGRGERGKLPRWLNKMIIEKTGWDYNSNRTNFFELTKCEIWIEGVYYTFADGSTAFEPAGSFGFNHYSVNSHESVYFRSSNLDALNNSINNVGNIYLPFVFPIFLPSITFCFSWGWCVAQLMYA